VSCPFMPQPTDSLFFPAVAGLPRSRWRAIFSPLLRIRPSFPHSFSFDSPPEKRSFSSPFKASSAFPGGAVRVPSPGLCPAEIRLFSLPPESSFLSGLGCGEPNGKEFSPFKPPPSFIRSSPSFDGRLFLIRNCAERAGFPYLTSSATFLRMTPSPFPLFLEGLGCD